MTSCKCNSGTSSEVCGRFGRWGVCWLDFGQHEWENLKEALYFHQEEGKRSRLASASPEQSRDYVTKGSPPTRFGHLRWAPCPLADLKASDHFLHPTRLCSKIHVLLLKQEGLQRLFVVSILPGAEDSYWWRRQWLLCTKDSFHSEPRCLVFSSEHGLPWSNKHCLFSICIVSIWITYRTRAQHWKETHYAQPVKWNLLEAWLCFSTLDPMILSSNALSQTLLIFRCDAFDLKA